MFLERLPSKHGEVSIMGQFNSLCAHNYKLTLKESCNLPPYIWQLVLMIKARHQQIYFFYTKGELLPKLFEYFNFKRIPTA